MGFVKSEKGLFEFVSIPVGEVNLLFTAASILHWDRASYKGGHFI